MTSSRSAFITGMVPDDEDGPTRYQLAEKGLIANQLMDCRRPRRPLSRGNVRDVHHESTTQSSTQVHRFHLIHQQEPSPMVESGCVSGDVITGTASGVDCVIHKRCSRLTHSSVVAEQRHASAITKNLVERLNLIE